MFYLKLQYKGDRWTVKDYEFKQVKEKDVTQRYSISISNRKIAIWDLVPTLTYSYTDKNSNIWQREYEKVCGPVPHYPTHFL
jgi:hypothetical protein